MSFSPTRCDDNDIASAFEIKNSNEGDFLGDLNPVPHSENDESAKEDSCFAVLDTISDNECFSDNQFEYSNGYMDLDKSNFQNGEENIYKQEDDNNDESDFQISENEQGSDADENDDVELYCEKDTESTSTTFNISGRRIIDIHNFLKQLKNLKHEGFGCSFFNMTLISEKIVGLQSIFSFKCEVCNLIQTVKSVNSDTPNNTVNLATVLGAVATGIGYSQLTELLAAMDIPNMSNKTYTNCQGTISLAINAENEKQMTEAAEEEKKLAIESGNVNEDGVPVISVIVDGAWSKRSYRTNYNALSGVACIIGAQTKKKLYMGVKNKYCYVCPRTNEQAHDCFKNWSNSSTAMESAIIAEGFQKSLESHGLIYGRVIGDGDSSVYKKLTAVAPYGPTFVIEKIECRNHLLRNYINKLADLSKDSRFPMLLRKKVTNSDTLGRFRNAVTKAIEFRKKPNDSFHKKVNLLKSDVINGPRHIFGDHSRCDPYFCSKNKEGEENLIPDLEISGLLTTIININKCLADNSGSLLHDVDTNAAETYNSVVAKFVGGKRTNFSLKGSYEDRCKAASISYNTKGNFLCAIMETLCDRGPGQYLQRFRERRRKMQTKKLRSFPRRKGFATVDEHYGLETANQINDMEAELYTDKSENFLQTLRDANIFQATIGQSDNVVWNSERRKRITASNFGKICKLKKTTSTAKTVGLLLYSTFKRNNATRFGLEHEDTAISLFQEQYGITVHKSGLIIDEEFPFLGCSPDGLLNDNAILEIKSSQKSGNLSPLDAVIQRKIDYCTIDNNRIFLKRNHNYYYQVQGLLHITKREMCYFIIYTKGGLYVEEIKRDDTFWKEQMVNKLCEFYMKSLLPELIDSRRCRQQCIRDVYMS